jgi:hypothetical protein
LVRRFQVNNIGNTKKPRFMKKRGFCFNEDD